MAQKPDEIQRDIEGRREILHARVRELRQRAEGDVATMRGAAQGKVDAYAQKAEGAKGKALDQVDQHPYLTMAGGLGLGFALGIAAPELSLGASGTNGHGAENNGEDRGLVGSVFGSLVGLTSGQIMQEMRTKFQEQISNFVDSVAAEKPGEDRAA